MRMTNRAASLVGHLHYPATTGGVCFILIYGPQPGVLLPLQG